VAALLPVPMPWRRKTKPHFRWGETPRTWSAPDHPRRPLHARARGRRPSRTIRGPSAVRIDCSPAPAPGILAAADAARVPQLTRRAWPVRRGTGM